MEVMPEPLTHLPTYQRGASQTPPQMVRDAGLKEQPKRAGWLGSWW
jgi:hypothetical protein